MAENFKGDLGGASIGFGKILAHPSTLEHELGNIILFQAIKLKGMGASSDPDGQIFLPSPESMSFGDTAGYGDLEQGAMGRMLDPESLSGTKKNVLAAVAGKNEDLAKLLSQELITSAIPGGEKVKGIINNKKQQVLNPSSVTAFESMGIREHSFEFTFVANNQDESLRINFICDMFRERMYAESHGEKAFLMDYPHMWDITFLTGSDESLKINKFMPGIARSYLTNCTVSYPGNAVHSNGAPVKTTISLSFKETKQLTRKDIQNLTLGIDV
jgi:hypothetical protein